MLPTPLTPPKVSPQQSEDRHTLINTGVTGLALRDHCSGTRSGLGLGTATYDGINLGLDPSNYDWNDTPLENLNGRTYDRTLLSEHLSTGNSIELGWLRGHGAELAV